MSAAAPPEAHTMSQRSTCPRFSCRTAWMLLATVSAGANPDDALPAGFYEVTTETLMPHLEENLRYSNTQVRRCLRTQDLALAFPALGYPALQGCRLGDPRRESDSLSYALSCNGNQGTRGTAHWTLDATTLRGVLEVRLGGKNMTFSQRVTATLIGTCPLAPAP
jgi:Protein of unknown function (DUF3617)